MSKLDGVLAEQEQKLAVNFVVAAVAVVQSLRTAVGMLVLLEVEEQVLIVVEVQLSLAEVQVVVEVEIVFVVHVTEILIVMRRMMKMMRMEILQQGNLQIHHLVMMMVLRLMKMVWMPMRMKVLMEKTPLMGLLLKGLLTLMEQIDLE